MNAHTRQIFWTLMCTDDVWEWRLETGIATSRQLWDWCATRQKRKKCFVRSKTFNYCRSMDHWCRALRRFTASVTAHY